MAATHGKNAVLKVGATTGVTSDISAYCTSIGFPYAADTHDTTVYGKNAKTYIPGLKDGTLPFDGNWDSTIDGILSPLFGAATMYFAYYPAGTGSVVYSGACILRKYDVNSPVGDVVKFSCELQANDTIANR